MSAKLRIDQWVTIVIICCILLIAGNISVTNSRDFLHITAPVEIEIASVPSMPLRKDVWKQLSSGQWSRIENKLIADSLMASISAKAVLVTDVASGTQLIVKNESNLNYPASTVKLMTALVALEKYSPQTLLTITSEDIQNSSLPTFFVGEQLTVAELLQALLISSSNSAAHILAREYPYGYSAFVKRMNLIANEFNMDKTTYIDPIGYDYIEQVSSAEDLEKLSDHFMKNNFLAEIVRQPITIISDQDNRYHHTLITTNQLLITHSDEVVGVKTGTTPNAGEVLISQFEFDGHSVRIVLMGSQRRFDETLELVRLVKENFVWVNPKEVIQALQTKTIKNDVK